MRLIGKTAIVLGIAGATALGAITTSQARARWVGPAVGFAAGAAVGAAVASNSYYYGSGYYGPGYAAYAYEPGYVYNDGPGYAYTGDPAYNYGYGYNSYNYNGYNTNYTGPMRERALQGRD